MCADIMKVYCTVHSHYTDDNANEESKHVTHRNSLPLPVMMTTSTSTWSLL